MAFSAVAASLPLNPWPAPFSVTSSQGTSLLGERHFRRFCTKTLRHSLQPPPPHTGVAALPGDGCSGRCAAGGRRAPRLLTSPSRPAPVGNPGSPLSWPRTW
jgi:hypothetical protein